MSLKLRMENRAFYWKKSRVLNVAQNKSQKTESRTHLMSCKKNS